MFYSQFILAKKGPLGTIWIAAHLERKLRKNQVADTDIGISVDSILFPEMPIALRLSSHLLLGVVRIYSRKVNYLFDDCSEALLKVKQAFRSTAVDLPPEESTAPYHSITLPETFDLDDFELPDSEMYQGNYVDHHISSKEQITLQDTMEGVVYSTSNFGLDERFGDGDACALDLEEELLVEKAATTEHASGTSNSEYPQASVQVNALIKYDHNQDNPIIPEVMPAGNIVNQHVEEYDGDDEPVEYAHAPCTPGLWEEPNLSNIQETSAYDDHQEPENHTITQVSVKENLEHASSDQHHNQFEPIEKLPPHIVITEQMSMNDLGSTPFTDSHIVDQVRSMSPIAEVSETVVSVVDDPVKVINSLNKNTTHQEPEIQTVDNYHENHVEYQGMSNNITHHVVNQENAFHPTNELELNTEPSCDQAFMQPTDSTVPVQSTHSFDFMGLRPCVTLSNHDAMNHASSLPPPEITSLPLPSLESSSSEEHPSAYGAPIMMQGEIPHTTEQLERNLQETYHAEVGPNNVVQLASSIPNGQLENVIERDVHVRNINNYTSDFIAPEKVLSFSQGHLEAPKDLLPESTTPIHQSAYTSSISNRQVDSVNEREVQVNNSNSYTSNFTAPEKLLSFSQDVPKNLVPESTPIIAPGYEGDAATTNRYSGRKRSITESSMTAQSLNFNLNESSTFFTTNNSRESFQDDDLLSSILVGRNSSILKMKPTPTPNVELPSTKRRRQSAPKTTPKTGVSKRKVLMDDNMVLHGDTIRQQLTNTEDIRRLRKKAPCTHSEISLIEKQFWEDELFGKAILTGMSNKLTSLQRQLHDISKNVISQYGASLEVGKTDQKSNSNNDEKDIQQEMGTENTGVSVGPDVLKENKEQDNFRKDVSEAQVVDVLEENKDQDNFDHVVMKDVSESQPIDNHIHDNNTTSFDYYENQEHMHTTGDFTELFGPEHDILEHATTMEIDVNSFQDADVGVPVMPIEAESLTHADVDANATFDTSAAMTQVDVVQSEAFDTSAAMTQVDVVQSEAFDTSEAPTHANDMSAAVNEVEKASQRVVTLLTGPPPGFDTYQKPNLQSVDNDSDPPMDISINKSIESNVDSERKLDDDDATVREIPEERQEASTTFSCETDGLKNDILTLEQDTEIRNNDEEIVNKDLECNPQNLVSNGVFSEELLPVAAYDAQVNPDLEDVLLDEREKPGHHVTVPVTTLNIEDIPTDNTVDFNDHDYTYSGVANDTDFLNFDDVDDDEAGEAADDYMPDGEETKILDNSGWSSRTRAVAKYLQIMFDKEGERGRNMLGVNNLLAGKTRKEASRMFFETLVLKTKDFIHVEQTDPFENINVFPRAKLLKSEF